MRSKYTQMDCKQLEAPQAVSKAFGAPHAQATPVALIISRSCMTDLQPTRSDTWHEKLEEMEEP